MRRYAHFQTRLSIRIRFAAHSVLDGAGAHSCTVAGEDGSQGVGGCHHARFSDNREAGSVEEGGFGQFDVLLDGKLVASKGGFWKRMITHGAPPQPQILAAIERALADRDGDSCELPAKER